MVTGIRHKGTDCNRAEKTLNLAGGEVLHASITQ
jgi:hypothetical protein